MCIRDRGRVFRDRNGRCYANQEAQSGTDKDLSRCVWVLLDFIDQVEYHTVGEFPAAILCFSNGELYEIVPIPQGKETMICQLLRQPQKDAGKRIVVVEDTSQIELLEMCIRDSRQVAEKSPVYHGSATSPGRAV